MMYISVAYCHIFFFNDTATTEIYTLSLHDALPICDTASSPPTVSPGSWRRSATTPDSGAGTAVGLADRPNPPAIEFSRSEEHTSELQSQSNLVCRLLLEKKKQSTHRIQEYMMNMC